MNANQESRVYLASFVASFAAALPTFAYSVFVVTTAGPDDDGAMRGIGFLFLAFPFLYLLFALLCYVMGTTFVSHGFTSFKRFMLATIFAFLAFSMLACLLFVNSLSVDTLRFLAGLAIFSLVSCLIASLCWWLIAVQPQSIELTQN